MKTEFVMNSFYRDYRKSNGIIEIFDLIGRVNIVGLDVMNTSCLTWNLQSFRQKS